MIRKYLIKPIIITLLVIAAYIFSMQSGVFDRAKFFCEDLFIHLRYSLVPVPSEVEDFVILSVDDTAYDYFDRKWPWGREIFAQIVYRLSAFEPKVIGLNMAFMGASKNETVDDLMSHAFEVAGNVFTVSYFDQDGKYHAPYIKLAESCRGFGLTDKPADSDQVIRRTRLFLSTIHDIILDYSFELKVACFAQDVPLDDTDFNGKDLCIKWDVDGQPVSRRIPVAADGTMPIDYTAQLKDFRVIPILEIIQGKVPPEAIKDKIVVMCMTGEAFRDLRDTPFGEVNGAVIIANNIIMLLRKSYVRQLPFLWYLLLLIVISLKFSLAGFRKGFPSNIIFLSLFIITFYLVNILLVIFNIRMDYFSIPFVLILLYCCFCLSVDLRVAVESIRLKRTMTIEPISRLATLHYLLTKLQKDLNIVHRRGGDLSLVTFQLKDYQQFFYSLSVADQNKFWREIAGLVKNGSRRTRNIDFISRPAEDKISALLLKTSMNNAKAYARRIKRTLATHKYLEQKIAVDVTVGIASYPQTKTNSPEQFISSTEDCSSIL